MSLVSVVCCVLSDVHNASICRSEQFYGVCVIVCDLETSAMRHPRPSKGCCATDRHISNWNNIDFLLLLGPFQSENNFTSIIYIFQLLFVSSSSSLYFLCILNLSIVYIVEKFYSVYFQNYLFNFMAT